MLKARDIPPSIIDRYLTITPGAILNIEAVKAALIHKRTSNDTGEQESVADVILSGIGGPPTFRTEVTICNAAINSILRGLNELQFTKPIGSIKPRLVLISTTGISTKKRDAPRASIVLYHLLAARPHVDKKNMERTVTTYWEDTPENERVIGGYMVVRASLLTNGKEYGLDTVRVGTDSNPAVGYTISREDVGLWIFEKAVKGEWTGAQEPTSITY